MPMTPERDEPQAFWAVVAFAFIALMVVTLGDGLDMPAETQPAPCLCGSGQ